MNALPKAKDNPKREFKRIGKAILAFWLFGTILIVIWPYVSVGWPEISTALDYWGYYSLICWGFLLGWFCGWILFVWDPKDSDSGDE